MEPRYARAKVYTGVAYYQLGRYEDAIVTLNQASELDDKDPLPYMLLTQIYTDLFRAGEAVDASREALKRLPYLKSLNQIANDQQGKANLGYSLAFFGLEDWALELAQDSYNAFSGASHLFLADRYKGEYNKNSELFQGFLTDPTAFGASNRFSTLVPTAGNYQTLGGTLTHDSGIMYTIPYLRLNGLVDWPARTAYYGDVERGTGNLDTVSTDPDGAHGERSGQENVEFYAFGLGSVPTDQLGLFVYGTKFRDVVTLQDYAGTTGTLDKSRIDAGLRWKFSPQSMTWLKFGQTEQHQSFANYYIFNADLTALNASNSTFDSRPQDAQLRHTIDLTPADHLAAGFEYARDTAPEQFLQRRRARNARPALAGGRLSQRPVGDVVVEASLRFLRARPDAGAVAAGRPFLGAVQPVDRRFQHTLIIQGDLNIPIVNRIVGSSTTDRWSPARGRGLETGASDVARRLAAVDATGIGQHARARGDRRHSARRSTGGHRRQRQARRGPGALRARQADVARRVLQLREDPEPGRGGVPDSGAQDRVPRAAPPGAAGERRELHAAGRRRPTSTPARCSRCG